MEANQASSSAIITAEVEQKFYRRFEESKRLYSRRIKRGLVYHHTSQLSILLGSALVPVLLTIPDMPRLIPTIISGIVLLASALATHYRFSERLRHLQHTLDIMIEEDTWKDLCTGPYHHLDRQEAFAQFVERTTRVVQEQNVYSFTYGDPRKSSTTKDPVIEAKSS